MGNNRCCCNLGRCPCSFGSVVLSDIVRQERREVLRMRLVCMRQDQTTGSITVENRRCDIPVNTTISPSSVVEKEVLK